MRAAVLIGLALAVSSAGYAAPIAGFQPGPAAPDIQQPDSAAPLPLSTRGRFAGVPRRSNLPLLGPEHAPPAAASGGFAIGPFHADTITKFSARSGKAHLAPHYRLDGVTLFGGAVGGSVDGRGGMLTLQWKTGS